MDEELVTVFGASGFIGRHVVRQLAEEGYRIRAAVRNPSLAMFLKPMGKVGQIQLFQANIRDEDTTEAAIAGARHVVNLVGILSESGRQRFDAVHVQAAERIARLSEAGGAKRLVHVSAIGANTESTSRYARTKAAGEKMVLGHFPNATILRPSIVFGPEDDFFNRFASMARITPALPLIGGGKTRFQPVYVGDVAAAVGTVLKRGNAAGRIYELGGPHVYTFRELLEFILQEIQRRRALVPIGFGVAKFMAHFVKWLPNPPLTPDQVELLKYDNIVSEGAAGFEELDLRPDSVEANVPAYLWRFRRSGQFTTPAAQ